MAASSPFAARSAAQNTLVPSSFSGAFGASGANAAASAAAGQRVPTGFPALQTVFMPAAASAWVSAPLLTPAAALSAAAIPAASAGLDRRAAVDQSGALPRSAKATRPSGLPRWIDEGSLKATNSYWPATDLHRLEMMDKNGATVVLTAFDGGQGAKESAILYVEELRDSYDVSSLDAVFLHGVVKEARKRAAVSGKRSPKTKGTLLELQRIGGGRRDGGRVRAAAPLRGVDEGSLRVTDSYWLATDLHHLEMTDKNGETVTISVTAPGQGPKETAKVYVKGRHGTYDVSPINAEHLHRIVAAARKRSAASAKRVPPSRKTLSELSRIAAAK